MSQKGRPALIVTSGKNEGDERGFQGHVPGNKGFGTSQRVALLTKEDLEEGRSIIQ